MFRNGRNSTIAESFVASDPLQGPDATFHWGWLLGM